MRQVQISRKEDVSFLPYFESGWAYLIFLSIFAFVMINSVMNYLTPAYNTAPVMIFVILVLVSGSLAGYFGLKQDRLYNEVPGLRPSIKTGNQIPSAKSKETPANEQPAKSTFAVSKEESKIIIDKLQHLLVSDKPFLNSKIRVIDVARKLDTSKHKLTYVINHEMGSNFYGIINEQRVIEAKMLLKHPKFKNYNLETIAEMSGFQSKSSFNAYFKKITGVTPSTYRKEH